MTKKRAKSGAQQLDDFLAAPENILKNEAELQKARERKAREAAEKKRLLASKSKVAPSIEDMIEDLNRVATCKATNKYWMFKAISRRRYELFGWFPIKFVDDQFGQFSHALEVAGLRDQAGTRSWRVARAAQSREEHAKRYWDRYVRPYTVSARKNRELTKPYLLLSISDTHAHFLDPFVWSVFLQAHRDLKPDGTLLNGDILDGGELSSHPQIRGRSLKLKDELAFQRTMYRQIRQVHDGDLYSTCGNHDLADRLPRYLSQVDPVVADIDDRRVDVLMGLHEFDVQLFHGGSTKSPHGTESAKPGFLMFDFYRVHHGTKLGETPAAAELRAMNRSGQSGHVHRASLHFGTTDVTEGMSWMSTPMGARHEVGHYMRTPCTGWQRGFGIAWLYPDGSVHQYPVVVTGSPERITIEGHTYTRRPGLDDPSIDRNWLEDLRVPK